jgi:polar amino acid transport system substrate-binding protein
VDSAEEAMQKLASGECNYTIMESYIGLGLLEGPLGRDITMVRETGENVEYCFAVRKGNPQILNIFTQGLEHLQRTGEFDEIQRQWVEKRLMISKRARDSIIISVSIGLAMSLGLILFLFLWSHLLKRQVKERTSELEAEIAERKKAQDQLLASQAQLMQADKMAAIGTMATGVAHEIDNPNSLILLNFPFLKGLMEEYLHIAEAKFQETGDFEVTGVPYSLLRVKLSPLLEDMQHASMRIKEIVNDLKKFVRTDSTDSLDWQEDFDLNKVAQSALRLLGNEIRKTTDQFHVCYGQNLPLIHGSSQKIEQVVLNLVLNACQALQCREASITLETGASSSQRIFLQVRDEGRGIEAEQMQYLFNPFFTTKRKQGGTGLGLFISEKIVKAHNGNLEINSTPGQGTTVLMTLPASDQARAGSIAQLSHTDPDISEAYP